MNKVFQFNTGRGYTKEGQIIKVVLLNDVVYFSDISRGIDYKFDLEEQDKFASLESLIMHKYDKHTYECDMKLEYSSDSMFNEASEKVIESNKKFDSNGMCSTDKATSREKAFNPREKAIDDQIEILQNQIDDLLTDEDPLELELLIEEIEALHMRKQG